MLRKRVMAKRWYANSQKTYLRDKCMHTHPCMYSRSYLQNTPFKITVWLSMQEVGKPTQSDRSHGNDQ